MPWPGMTWGGARVVPDQGFIEVTLAGDPEGDLRGRGALSEEEAALAVEQVVRTAQAAVQERLPVRFLLFGQVTDRVLGVPASEPLAEGSDLDVLAHVSIANPSEGQVVDNDQPLVVSGAASSFEGTVITFLEDAAGEYAVTPVPAITGCCEDRLFPFEATLDLSDVAPGEYVVRSQTDDPSGDERQHVDTRTITVVD